MPDPGTEPLINPECAGCKRLAVALRETLRLLSGVDSDANNVQLDIARLHRRYHREIEEADNA